MKKLQKQRISIIISLLVFMIFCLPVQAASTKKTLYAGQTYTLKFSGMTQKAKWSASNKKVATVNAKGKVTAKRAGTTTITAKANGKIAKCKITVKNPSIKLNKKSAVIYTSGTKTVQLKAAVKGKSSKVTWKSSNKKIATVNSKGKVTAKKTGTVTITAKANGKTAKCKVKVKLKKSRKLTKKEQHKLYQATIKNYDKKMRKGALKCGETGLATYFTFADIDGNGIDELILRYEYTRNEHKTNIDSGYAENTYIYTINNGHVKIVLSSGEYSSWIQHSNFVKVYKNSNLINRGFSHEPMDDIFYKYSNGKLSSKRTLSIVTGSICSINGKICSRQECRDAFNKATNNDTGYPMYLYKESTFYMYI